MIEASLYTDWNIYEGGWLDFDKLSVPMAKEIMETIIGPMIADGTSRSVFSCIYDPGIVFKFQKSFGQQNAVEVHLWERFRGVPKVARWLAPILSRSSSNRVIVQRRTLPMTKAPKKLPSFLTDTKTQNYGMLDGRVVAHDFGLMRLFDWEKSKMEPVKWWDGPTNKEYVECARGGTSGS